MENHVADVADVAPVEHGEDDVQTRLEARRRRRRRLQQQREPVMTSSDEPVAAASAVSTSPSPSLGGGSPAVQVSSSITSSLEGVVVDEQVEGWC